MSRKLLLMFRLLTLACTISFSQSLHAANAQYENQIIETFNIIIEGGVSSPAYHERIVRSRIKTKENDLFSQAEFDNDLKSLSKEFDRIEPSLELVDGKMHITLRVWPKPLIRSINWEGNKGLSNSYLESELGITPGTTFDRQTFNQGFHKIKAYYVKKGYFEAQLQYRVALDPESYQVDIFICINEGRAGRIRDVFFRGFTDCEIEDISEMIYTKTYNFFTSWLTDEGTYNEEAVQQDQFIIIDYLQSEGYADVDVKIEVCEDKYPNRINLVITAIKGPRYHFGKVTFEGNTIFCDEDIEKQLNICEGQTYSPKRIRNSIDALTKLYGRKGYIDTIVDYESKLDACDQIYHLHVKIEEGEQYRVGLIKILGNCSTQTKVILHETLLIPGEVFNIEKLTKTEERLRNIGYFANVNVYAVKTEEGQSCLEGAYRDVHIEVEETSTGNFSLSVGYSNMDSIFGGLTLTEKNFNWRGLGHVRQDGFKALRGGGEFVYLNATVGAKNRKYVCSWTKPHFNDTPWSLGFDVQNSNDRNISQDYEITAWQGMVHTHYDCNAFLRTGWHYRLRHAYYELGEDPSPALKYQADHAGLVSAIGTTLSYDTTDSFSRPSKGFRSRLDAEYAGVLGDFYFFSFAYLNSYYYKTDKRGILKFRADFRFIQPLVKAKVIKDEDGNTVNVEGSVPLDEHLFLGGENEIRGYRNYRLGPVFGHDEDNPEGGISLQLYSIEYRRRLYKKLDAFVFFDAGQVSNKEWYCLGRIYTSVGVGVQFQIIDHIPPITLGYGFPINPKNRGDIQRFFFNMGAKF